MNAMRKYAVIVAGGSGLRMGADKPKQFLLLQGKPILWHTLNAFLAAFSDISIKLVLPLNFMNEGKQLVASFNEPDRIELVTGGATRFDSVKNGLKTIDAPGIVFVHDGVRCLVSKELIHRCYEQAIEKGSAIPAIAATDSIRIETEQQQQYVVNRAQVKIIQTPQTFQTEILLPAFEREYQIEFTDEATVVETSGQQVFLIDGDYQNIKITRPIDLFIAEQILQDKTN